MTISGGCAGGFPAARHYPAALVQLSIWGHLKYRAHYGTANLGAFFNKPRLGVPTAANAAEGVSGWDSLWARVGWKVIRVILLQVIRVILLRVIRVILLRGNKYLGLRKARIGRVAMWAGKGYLGSAILQLFQSQHFQTWQESERFRDTISRMPVRKYFVSFGLNSITKLFNVHCPFYTNPPITQLLKSPKFQKNLIFKIAKIMKMTLYLNHLISKAYKFQDPS